MIAASSVFIIMPVHVMTVAELCLHIMRSWGHMSQRACTSRIGSQRKIHESAYHILKCTVQTRLDRHHCVFTVPQGFQGRPFCFEDIDSLTVAIS